MESDNEITGTPRTHYTASFWQYDSRIGRRWNVDPLIYPWHSSYATFNNNPVLYLDEGGDEPREGNTVLEIDFTRCFISNSTCGRVNGLIDRKPSFEKYDRHLYRSAFDRLAHVTDITPGGSYIPWPKPFQAYFQIQGDLAKLDMESSMMQTNLAYSWIMASKSKNGYLFVEFKEENNKHYLINREVVNLNEELGVEGFENVVREKSIFEISENGERSTVPESIEYFLYRTVENEEGEKIVQFKTVKLDFSVAGLPLRKDTDWEKAIPEQYTPNENQATNEKN